MWEAQFGDFANGAQVIIDQFLSSGEDKWMRQTGLVLLLPHGYEGQGPEHSSGRLERFLQMTSEPGHIFPTSEHMSLQVQRCNWQVVNLTTPAQYFHALRRQLARQFRKPLIIMTPKSLLRLGRATSTLEQMAPGTRMLWLIPEHDREISSAGAKVSRVILCSGKVYYDLVQYREKKGIKNVAILRIEQLSPFPFQQLREQSQLYPKAEWIWVQEEPMNQGAYSYAAPRVSTSLNLKNWMPRYVGRGPTASTATGYHSVHEKELAAFTSEAFAF